MKLNEMMNRTGEIALFESATQRTDEQLIIEADIIFWTTLAKTLSLPLSESKRENTIEELEAFLFETALKLNDEAKINEFFETLLNNPLILEGFVDSAKDIAKKAFDTAVAFQTKVDNAKKKVAQTVIKGVVGISKMAVKAYDAIVPDAIKKQLKKLGQAIIRKVQAGIQKLLDVSKKILKKLAEGLKKFSKEDPCVKVVKESKSSKPRNFEYEIISEDYIPYEELKNYILFENVEATETYFSGEKAKILDEMREDLQNLKGGLPEHLAFAIAYLKHKGVKVYGRDARHIAAEITAEKLGGIDPNEAKKILDTEDPDNPYRSMANYFRENKIRNLIKNFEIQLKVKEDDEVNKEIDDAMDVINNMKGSACDLNTNERNSLVNKYLGPDSQVGKALAKLGLGDVINGMLKEIKEHPASLIISVISATITIASGAGALRIVSVIFASVLPALGNAYVEYLKKKPDVTPEKIEFAEKVVKFLRFIGTMAQIINIVDIIAKGWGGVAEVANKDGGNVKEIESHVTSKAAIEDVPDATEVMNTLTHYVDKDTAILLAKEFDPETAMKLAKEIHDNGIDPHSTARLILYYKEHGMKPDEIYQQLQDDMKELKPDIQTSNAPKTKLAGYDEKDFKVKNATYTMKGGLDDESIATSPDSANSEIPDGGNTPDNGEIANANLGTHQNIDYDKLTDPKLKIPDVPIDPELKMDLVSKFGEDKANEIIQDIKMHGADPKVIQDLIKQEELAGMGNAQILASIRDFIHNGYDYDMAHKVFGISSEDWNDLITSKTAEYMQQHGIDSFYSVNGVPVTEEELKHLEELGYDPNSLKMTPEAQEFLKHLEGRKLEIQKMAIDELSEENPGKHIDAKALADEYKDIKPDPQDYQKVELVKQDDLQNIGNPQVEEAFNSIKDDIVNNEEFKKLPQEEQKKVLEYIKYQLSKQDDPQKYIEKIKLYGFDKYIDSASNIVHAMTPSEALSLDLANDSTFNHLSAEQQEQIKDYLMKQADKDPNFMDKWNDPKINKEEVYKQILQGKDVSLDKMIYDNSPDAKIINQDDLQNIDNPQVEEAFNSVKEQITNSEEFKKLSPAEQQRVLEFIKSSISKHSDDPQKYADIIKQYGADEYVKKVSKIVDNLTYDEALNLDLANDEAFKQLSPEVQEKVKNYLIDKANSNPEFMDKWNDPNFDREKLIKDVAEGKKTIFDTTPTEDTAPQGQEIHMVKQDGLDNITNPQVEQAFNDVKDTIENSDAFKHMSPMDKERVLEYIKYHMAQQDDPAKYNEWIKQNPDKYLHSVQTIIHGMTNDELINLDLANNDTFNHLDPQTQKIVKDYLISKAEKDPEFFDKYWNNPNIDKDKFVKIIAKTAKKIADNTDEVQDF